MNRENWLNNAVTELRPVFDTLGYPLPEKIKVTCGFPSRHARSLNRAIGEHWSDKASVGANHEIMISPVVDDAVEVFAILCHELAHSASDGDGHRGRFPAIVKGLLLEGKPTSTVAGKAFKDQYADLIDGLGAYPHEKLNVTANRKVQSTRMLKAVCGCGYVIRLTKTWADQGLPTCVCGAGFTLAK